MKNKIKASIIVIGIALTTMLVYNSMQDNTNKCVNIYIDFGKLSNGEKIIQCTNVNGKTNALDILKKSNLKIDGTEKYGSNVVCRVDNLPGPAVESCLSMPSEKAYWAVLIKRHQVIPNPFDINRKWGWAQTGISEVYLDSGDSLGLVFANNGKVEFPN